MPVDPVPKGISCPCRSWFVRSPLPWCWVSPRAARPNPSLPHRPPSTCRPTSCDSEGAGAEVSRDGTSSPVELGDPVLFGDRLDSAQAYAQILWGDGSRLALDRGTQLEALAPDLLALTAGRVLVTRPSAAAGPLRVDTPAGSLLLSPDGEYRIELDGDVTTLAVVRGHADVQTGMGDQPVEAGQQLALRDGLAPEAPRRFNAAGYDSFAEWARTPSTAPAPGAPLDTFQDPRFEAYSDVFNRYGTWETDAQFGAVWFPQVGADWRPYADGYWQSYGPQSQWLWVGRDPWGWPTHHFGRWGANGRGRWFWMPGRQWGPAWVDWSVGPGFIGWTPLGATRPAAGGLERLLAAPWRPLGWGTRSRPRLDRHSLGPLRSTRATRRLRRRSTHARQPLRLRHPAHRSTRTIRRASWRHVRLRIGQRRALRWRRRHDGVRAGRLLRGRQSAHGWWPDRHTGRSHRPHARGTTGARVRWPDPARRGSLRTCPARSCPAQPPAHATARGSGRRAAPGRPRERARASGRGARESSAPAAGRRAETTGTRQRPTRPLGRPRHRHQATGRKAVPRPQ